MKNLIKICLSIAIVIGASIIGINIPMVQASETNSSLEPTIVATYELPTSYDLRDNIYIQVENQYSLGLCYSFASLSSVETYLALNYGEYYDFSELHLATSLYMRNGERDSIYDVPSAGGNFGHFLNYSLKDRSLVLEDEMPLSDYPTNPSYFTSSHYTKLQQQYNSIDSNFYSIAKVNNIATFGDIYGNKSNYSSTQLNNLRNKVKFHIMNYGSLAAGIHWSTTYLKNSINYKVVDDSMVSDSTKLNSYIDHLISIVGWDDSYDAGGTWSNPGAYICLNSWGEDWGENGFFYVSYDDYFIEYSLHGVTDVSLSTKGNTISSFINNQDKTYNVVHKIQVSTSELYLAYILDVSSCLNQSITQIDNFVKGTASSFYIKFFDSRDSALSNIASLSSTNNKVATSLANETYYYNRYSLSSPLKITNNYILIAVGVSDIYRATSITTKSSYNISLEPSYYASGLHFDASYTWNSFLHKFQSDVDGDYTLPIVLHTNGSFYEVSEFSNGTLTVDGEHIKNNLIGINHTLSFTISNASVDPTLIKVSSLVAEGKTDVTSNFSIVKTTTSPAKINVTMTKTLSSNFDEGQYIISIPVGTTTIYRVIEVKGGTIYNITYELNGGTLDTKPMAYADSNSILTISDPTRAGYAFVAWYLDSSFNQMFDCTNLPYTDITLYAKWDFAAPTITSKSESVETSYYQGLKINIKITALHALSNNYNTLSYQWYKRAVGQTSYTIIDGATNSSLSLYNVADSGYYVCKVSINISDPSMTTTPCTRTLEIQKENEILVSITKLKITAKWNYSSALPYNGDTQKVELVGLPDGVSANYSNNEFTDIGKYTASAALICDGIENNPNVETVQDLNWEIRKAKITITIKDIISKSQISASELHKMFECEINSEYFPENISSQEQKIAYLNLKYSVSPTSHPYIKQISATTNNFDVYDISIINGEYRMIVNTLHDDNIVTTSDTGFIFDCEFSATALDGNSLDNNVKDLLEKDHLESIIAYQLSYSFLEEGADYSVFIPVERDLLYKGLDVYILKDNKLVKASNVSCSEDGIYFDNDMQDATIFVVEKNKNYTSNVELITCICIIVIFIASYITIIVGHIKHKHEFF